jgi:predicted ester cyclase
MVSAAKHGVGPPERDHVADEVEQFGVGFGQRPVDRTDDGSSFAFRVKQNWTLRRGADGRLRIQRYLVGELAPVPAGDLAGKNATPVGERTASTGIRSRATELYDAFLTAFNAGDLDAVASVISPEFEDHHPGFEISGRDSYLTALRQAHETLRIQGELLEIIEADDKIVTRVRLTGKHVGTVMGVEATGRNVAWDTNEIWRVEDGLLVERWAVDDLLGLREQMSRDADDALLAPAFAK